MSFRRRLVGVKSVHFLVRDRMDDETPFSFKGMVDPQQKRLIKRKMTYELGTYFQGDRFAIDPASDSPLHGYAAWDLEKRIVAQGLKKVEVFTDFLCAISRLLVEKVEKEYFASNGEWN